MHDNSLHEEGLERVFMPPVFANPWKPHLTPDVYGVDAILKMVTALENELAIIKEQLIMRERQIKAMQANILKAAEALKRASAVEPRSRGRLP